MSVNTTTHGTTCTLLGDINGNRRTTTFMIDMMRVAGNNMGCMDIEMTQGEPKRVCTDEMAIPWREESLNILQLCDSAIETTEDSVIIVAELTMDCSLEIGKTINENQLSDSPISVESSQERSQTRRYSTR